MVAVSVVNDRVRQAARQSYFGDFVTPLGREWAMREEAFEAYHARNSADWDYLRDLHANMDSLADNTWSTTVATAYAIINNHVTETYFGNPESWIQAKSGDPDGAVSKIFRDIANTVHRDADTAGIFQRALGDEGYAGFGGHWTYPEQIDEDQPRTIDKGDGTTDYERGEDGSVKLYPQVVQQRVCGDYVEPWDLRFDPAGRDWKLRDHKYVARRYYKTLATLLDLPYFDEEGKAMLRSWAATHRRELSSSSDVGWRDINTTEMDPRYSVVPMYEIWDRVTKMVIHKPIGATFHCGQYPWPRAWRYANTFPLTFIAFNREPGDRQKTRGFYPIPLLRLIHKQIENINRLEGLYMEAATVNVIKFLTVKGLLGDDEITMIDSDKSRVVIAVDLMRIKDLFPTAINDLGQLDLRRLFTLIPMQDRSSELFDYESALNHEVKMISRVIGTGSQDRYGLPDSKTATEAAGLMDAMAKRQQFKTERAADKYDEVTEKIFLIFKTMQTLPIEYQASTDYEEGTWRKFTDLSKIRTINLAFYHRMGMGTLRDPAAEGARRTQTAQMILPIYANAGDMTKVDALVAWMLEPQNFRDIAIIKAQGYKDTAMQLAEMITMLQVNPKLASDPSFADQKANLTSTLVMQLLSPAEKQQVAANVEQSMRMGTIGAPQGGGQQQPAGPGQGTGSLQAQPSDGQAAFASAAAAGQNGSAAAGRSTVGAPN